MLHWLNINPISNLRSGLFLKINASRVYTKTNNGYWTLSQEKFTSVDLIKKNLEC
jgi:hypothetical protein